jgi:diketogulonate reductase-like aldo/keto reductase
VQQECVAAIPGALNDGRLRESLKVREVTLMNEEMADILTLAGGTRIVDSPRSLAWDSA